MNRDGVDLTATAGTGNAVLGNSIFDNARLGIDLKADAVVTPNDSLDSDIGANNLQNFPGLTGAASDATQTTIKGGLSSTAAHSFRIEFFANESCDPSTHGEGKTLVGTSVVATNIVGFGAFTATISPPVPAGNFITATATDSASNTSAFSACAKLVTKTTTSGPGLSGQWLALWQDCKPAGHRIKCRIAGTLAVTNPGNQIAARSVLDVLLSADDSADPGDLLLEEVKVGPVAPGETVDLKANLPKGLSASGGFAIAILDVTKVVPEANEDNNVVVSDEIP